MRGVTRGKVGKLARDGMRESVEVMESAGRLGMVPSNMHVLDMAF